MVGSEGSFPRESLRLGTATRFVVSLVTCQSGEGMKSIGEREIAVDSFTAPTTLSLTTRGLKAGGCTQRCVRGPTYSAGLPADGLVSLECSAHRQLRFRKCELRHLRGRGQKGACASLGRVDVGGCLPRRTPLSHSSCWRKASGLASCSDSSPASSMNNIFRCPTGPLG